MSNSKEPTMSGLPGGVVTHGPVTVAAGGAGTESTAAFIERAEAAEREGRELLEQSGLEAEYGQPLGEHVPPGDSLAARAFWALEALCQELEALRAANKQLQAELAVARGAAWDGPPL